MTLDDPFFVVKDDVVKAVLRTKGLYQRWFELHHEDANIVAKEEIDWVSTELKNSLRSIEWDLEDLEETITIVEKNPKKFKIEGGELNNRRTFIGQTREDIKCMKDKMNHPKNRDRQTRQPLLSSTIGGGGGGGGYTRLQNDVESPTHQFIENNMQQQAVLISEQDQQLDMIQDSMGTLKTMSSHIGRELDEQAIMLDDFGNEIEMTESKMDAAMKKVAKVLHMSNDRRQWIVIGVLSGIIFVVLLLLTIL